MPQLGPIYLPEINLPEWFPHALESWPTLPEQLWKRLLLYAGLSISSLGIASYVTIRYFADWLIDDFLLVKGIKSFLSRSGPVTSMCHPMDCLEKHARLTPDKPFIVYQQSKYTFRQVDDIVNQHANTFLRLGITREQKVALLMRNQPEFLFIYYGLMKLGVPVSLVNNNLRGKVLTHVIKEAATMNFIVSSDEDLVEAVGEIHNDIQTDGVRIFVYGKTKQYESLTDELMQSTSQPVPISHRSDLGFQDTTGYIFTSGTTGLPKAARITYGKYKLAAGFLDIFGCTPDDIIYAPLPLYHSSALLTFNNSCLLLGCTFVLGRKFSVKYFWDECRMNDVTVIQYIGETCRYLLSKPSSPNDKEHKVRVAIGNGLRRDIWTEFKTRFNIKKIGEFYASTEGNILFANMTNKTGACGRCSPLVTMKTSTNPRKLFLKFDVEKESVVRDSQGLCVQAELGEPGLAVCQITETSRFEGYTNKQQTEKKILKDVLTRGDNYFNTGDLLMRDKDYFVYFIDRIGDTFRWKGENVSTLEVSNSLQEINSIADCNVYGVDIPGMDGRAGMAAIVLEKGMELTPEILKQIYLHCDENLPGYARPVFIRFLNEMTLTVTFKHQKFNLQKEGFNVDKVKELYLHDTRAQTYQPMTRQLYDDIIGGHFKL